MGSWQQRATEISGVLFYLYYFTSPNYEKYRILIDCESKVLAGGFIFVFGGHACPEFEDLGSVAAAWTEDPDVDQLPNILEYYFKRNPHLPE